MRSSASIVRSTEALRIALTTYGVIKPLGIPPTLPRVGHAFSRAGD